MDQKEYLTHLHTLTNQDKVNILKAKKLVTKVERYPTKVNSYLKRKIQKIIDFLLGFFYKIDIDDLISNTNIVSQPNRKLHIYFRHVHEKTNNTSRDPKKIRPIWFTPEICFKNLVYTIKSDLLASRVQITIIYDGTLDDYNDDFIANFYEDKSINICVKFITAGSDLNSFLITLNLLRDEKIHNTDLIYLLENDYLHQPGWVSKVFELYESGHKFDYVSLYDHPYCKQQYPSMKKSDLITHLIHSKTHHWRNASSTCASFILNKIAFEKAYKTLISCKTDYYFFEVLTRKKGGKLISAVPGLSTHAMEGLLSPTIDWEKISRINFLDN
jgi:hypothetical protein